jgi:probable HAF family extracellular repeat protein
MVPGSARKLDCSLMQFNKSTSTKNMTTQYLRKSTGRSPLRYGFVLIPLAIAVFAISPTAKAVSSYIVIDLGTLGLPYSNSSGINDSGQVTGASDIAFGVGRHAFLYSNGSMTDLGTLDSRHPEFTSAGFGINNLGQVTGGSDYARPARIFVFRRDDAGFKRSCGPGRDG